MHLNPKLFDYILIQFSFQWLDWQSSLHWLVLVLFCAFLYNGVYLCPKIKVCAKGASKIIVPLKEILSLFSIGTFLTNYDNISRKLKCVLISSIVQKWQKGSQKKPMETTDRWKRQQKWFWTQKETFSWVAKYKGKTKYFFIWPKFS